MQDPMMAQMIGQNPQAKQIMASLQAHVAEHLGFSYRQKIEAKLGVPLPAPNEELPEAIEIELSRMIADAGKQLTQANQKQAAQQKAQQQAKDPIIQMKQAELQIKQAEEQRKAANDQADMQIRQEQLKLQKAKEATSAMLDAEKIKLDQASLAIEAEEKGVRLEQAGRAERNKLGIETARMMQSRQPKGDNS
tara:strand:- start:1219 stop:1797 length:579 start_codon:yes stop_codon:yes gene_type:complete